MDLRLNLMRNLLQSDESQYRKKVKSRFNRLQNKLRQHRDNQVNTIRHNLKRNLRKLYRKHSNNQQFRKFDVIERHTCLESNLYESQIHCYNEHSQKRHEKLELLNENYIERKYNYNFHILILNDALIFLEILDFHRNFIEWFVYKNFDFSRRIHKTPYNT